MVVLRESSPVRNLAISWKPSSGIFSRSSQWGSSSIWHAGTGEPWDEAELSLLGHCSTVPPSGDIESFSSLTFDFGSAAFGHPGSWEHAPQRPLGETGEPLSSWDVCGPQLGQPAHWAVLQTVEQGVSWGFVPLV